MGFSRTYVHRSSSGASRGAHFVYARGSTLGSASDCALASDASDAKTTSAHNAPAPSECMSYAARVRKCVVACPTVSEDIPSAEVLTCRRIRMLA